ncbi:MAG: amidoligase family protein, partial [Candidatus Competibacterales bacterium]|nr:amidoligase family protein [Candidatus Competibacterales bacterium]
MHPASSAQSRRVGVEIEFSGLSVRTAAEQVAGTFGGALAPRTPYEIAVTGTTLGDFQVEVDFALLKRLGQARTPDADG